jgi:transcription initiation factor TFIIB
MTARDIYESGRLDEIRQQARTLTEQAEERGVTTGIHPARFAAACLYRVDHEEGGWLTQPESYGCGEGTRTTNDR